MIKVAVLTSSRADYGIYLPLLNKLRDDETFDLSLVVFGTHLSKHHGYTIDNIIQDGFKIYKKIESLQIGDTPNSIATSYATTVLKFTEFWEQHKNDYNFVFVLGDRYEMAAAVAASIPYQIRIVHIHGGETTIGATDNIYRHFITLSSSIHFVSAEPFLNRIKAITADDNAQVLNVGSLSLENLETIKRLSLSEFYEKWNIDLSLSTILITVHPETVNYDFNVQHAEQICLAIKYLAKDFQVIITLPNSDVSGLIFRESFLKLSKEYKNVICIENFGTQSYFTVMENVELLIGNTSSGIIEAASFNKYVLNLGNRQLGRLSNENVINIEFNADIIEVAARKLIGKKYTGTNLYYKMQPSALIIDYLKNYNVEN
jgi:GDP/UDP-N,N'-diacetylbacillosamine 2-epimerase (hydrolysing)